MLAKRTKIALTGLLSCSMLAPSLGMAASSSVTTKTPIQHVVVIFPENVSFDHYFATYPQAANPVGEPRFTAVAGTPSANNLMNAGLLTTNPNFTNTQNGSSAGLPFRLDRTQAASADQNHAYTPEQKAYDNGKMDLFPLNTGRGSSGGVGAFGTNAQVMGYYDGNTVTALWRYAQRYAMSDNAWSDTYGPSTPGALEVVSGQTNGVVLTKGPQGKNIISDGQGGYTLIGDNDPGNDVCSTSSTQFLLQNAPNIGDLLNAQGITWGGFMGGFDLTRTNADGSTGCGRQTFSAVVGAPFLDYVVHHAWFQYFTSTANPTHARPNSTAAIGYTMIPGTSTKDPANHQYDIEDFFTAVSAGNFPAVSYIKPIGIQEGHPGYSDPLDEQAGIVRVVNFLQSRPEWANTAIIIAWDDSDGWYDHAFTPPTHSSYDPNADQLNGAGVCGTGTQPLGVAGKPVNGRCGPGTRIPLMVISPWARKNYISHVQVSQSSVVRFIEDNWLNGQRLGNGSFDATAGALDDMFDFTQVPDTSPLFLNPVSGNIVHTTAAALGSGSNRS